MSSKTNIILIGMPGSGKSTVGIILAKMLTLQFVDTDILIQNQHQRSLQDIVNKEGHLKLREIEEQVLLGVDLDRHVIATGGSAAYSEPAMLHLKKKGVVLFLNAGLSTLRSRIKNYDERGLAKKPDQSFENLFSERFDLYTKYADFTIESSGKSQDEVCFDIMTKLSKSNHPLR